MKKILFILSVISTTLQAQTTAIYSYIDQIDKSPDNTVSLIKYVHLRHKKNKVEIIVQKK